MLPSKLFFPSLLVLTESDMDYHTIVCSMFSILESVAFDTGYAGSAGIQPQSWVNGNGTSYIYFGSGEFDGQGSGHDFYGTVRSCISNLLLTAFLRPTLISTAKSYHSIQNFGLIPPHSFSARVCGRHHRIFLNQQECQVGVM